MARQHPLLLLAARLRPCFANRELGFATILLTVAVVLGLVGLGFFINFTIESKTVGDLWFKVPIPIPMEQRVRYLRIAIFLWALALLAAVAGGSMLLQYRNNRADREAAREEARREYARQEAHRQWLETPAGYAHSMTEAGLLEFNLVLRIQPPLHLDALRQIQQVGWTVDAQYDHPPVMTKESTADGRGGHEVVRTTVQDATFCFKRKPAGA